MKRKLFILMLAACSLLSCTDGIWDAIHGLEYKYSDLDARVAYLEDLCSKMNTNISALQTLVSVILTNDYIISIAPITKDGQEIGYVITFAIHEPITIYNGQDGQDGADGKDGQDGKDGTTPIIGVALDPTDNAYYWTLNGEWLLDENGDRIPLTSRDGQDGEDGKDGVDGQDGKDGVTPQLKIEDGYWYVSTDNGATWTQLGKATGEDGADGKDGQDGADGKDGQDGEKGEKGDPGDTMFQSVTQDGDFVYFTLADGTVLIVPRGKNKPSEDDIIDFKDLAVKRRLLKLNIDTTGDGEITYGEAAAFSGNISLGSDAYYSFKEFQYFTNISSFSFNDCTNLFEIVLPNHITEIPKEAFNHCSSLMTIKLPEGCTVIGNSAFTSCSSLNKIILPQGLKRIEQSAFFLCSSLTSLDIPNSVNYIAWNALQSLPLDTLVLPESYVSDMIGALNTTVTTIIWNSISYPSDYVYEYYGDEYYGIGEYATSASGALLNEHISTIIIGEKVELLPKYFCYKMKNITLYSRSLEPPYLVSNAFYSCTFKKIYVPQASVDKYKTAWSGFADKIEGYDFE